MKKNIIRIFLTVFFMMNIQLSYAGYAEGKISSFYTSMSGEVLLGLVVQAPSTCSYFNCHHKFDGTTAAGKNLLSTLISAKLSQSKVAVWYTKSTIIGTDNTTGCTRSTMGDLTSIGIK